jgi:hypothetical protein
MIDLALVILFDRLLNWGLQPVIAGRVIAADAPTLRALVADPAAQWRLIDRVSARLRPQVNVEPGRSPRVVRVRVRLGRRDVLWITWLLPAGLGTTEVTLAAQFESRGMVTRLTLLLGGRAWLRRRLEATLDDLASLALCAAEDLDDVERHADFTTTRSKRPDVGTHHGTAPAQGAT